MLWGYKMYVQILSIQTRFGITSQTSFIHWKRSIVIRSNLYKN